MSVITANPLQRGGEVATSIWGAAELASWKVGPCEGFPGGAEAPLCAYPWYSKDETYVQQVQADGGRLSEWEPQYAPTAEQAALDRLAAYAAGVPHGYQPPRDQYAGLPVVSLRVVSELHSDGEYGARVDAEGRHHGGPFRMDVAPKMRVQDVRRVIMEKSGIPVGLQRLSYAGKHMEDSQRTLEHYGVAYWHARFPDWPLKIRCY